jgi:hypothetical protein
VPSHAPLVVAVPAVHPPPHNVPFGSVHALRSAPLQVAVVHPGSPDVALVHCVRAPCGAPVTAVQTPPVPSHASHCPLHAALQQTPSAQKPVEHCAPVVQACPWLSVHAPGCGPLQVPLAHDDEPQQTPSVQKRPDLHWLDVVHGAPCVSRMTQLPALQK